MNLSLGAGDVKCWHPSLCKAQQECGFGRNGVSATCTHDPAMEDIFTSECRRAQGRAVQEVLTMRSLRHPAILPVLAHFQVSSLVLMIELTYQHDAPA